MAELLARSPPVQWKRSATALCNNSPTTARTYRKPLLVPTTGAWQAFGIVLAGDGLFDQIKKWIAPGEEKAFAEQVRLFLASNPLQLGGSSAHYRKACLADLKKARQADWLSLQDTSPQVIARQTASFQRFVDPEGMIDGAWKVVAQIADDLAGQCPNLAQLLRHQIPGGPPLLVAAFAYFFRRELEKDHAPAQGLVFDSLWHLSASQDKAFAAVNTALATLDDKFDQVFEQLERIETAVVETHGVVLDMQAELYRIGSMSLANSEEVGRLLQEVLNRVSQVGMQKGEVKPHHSQHSQ